MAGKMPCPCCGQMTEAARLETLVASLGVAKLIADAEARGMERAAKVAATVPVTAIKATEQTAHALRIVEAIRRASEGEKA